MSKQVGSTASPADASFAKKYGLIIGLIVMLGIMMLPAQTGLPVAGQRMLAILVFSVIVWMTDTISYPVSAGAIMALMAFSLGVSPDPAAPAKLMSLFWQKGQRMLHPKLPGWYLQIHLLSNLQHRRFAPSMRIHRCYRL